MLKLAWVEWALISLRLDMWNLEHGRGVPALSNQYGVTVTERVEEESELERARR